MFPPLHTKSNQKLVKLNSLIAEKSWNHTAGMIIWWNISFSYQHKLNLYYDLKENDTMEWNFVTTTNTLHLK